MYAHFSHPSSRSLKGPWARVPPVCQTCQTWIIHALTHLAVTAGNGYPSHSESLFLFLFSNPTSLVLTRVFQVLHYLNPALVLTVRGTGLCLECWRIAARWATWEYSHRRVRRRVDRWRADWRAGNPIDLRIWALRIRRIRVWGYAPCWALLSSANIRKGNFMGSPKTSHRAPGIRRIRRN